jgi:60 kDa SS-A/Ro ribonucleoprotein
LLPQTEKTSKGKTMPYSQDLRATNATECDRTRPDMIAGRGGGYGFEISDVDRLTRFLVLGHEGGTYYASQRERTFETVDCIDRLLQIDPTGASVVDLIVNVSSRGRAPKNDAAIFALAYVASKSNHPASYRALDAVPNVCRIGTHLFDFLEACKTLNRGWGTAFKRAINQWYDRSPIALARQVTKYAQRNGWSQRDVLRKCHFKTDDPDLNQVLQFVTQPAKWYNEHENGNAPVTTAARYLAAVKEAQIPNVSERRLCELILEFGLPREVIPTTALNSVAVWDALLQNMPLTAMIRNLGKMTSIGLIKPFSEASTLVTEALGNAEQLAAQRVHPITLLLALKVYQRGRGVRGSLRWNPDQQVSAALDTAFYTAFGHVRPTNKRLMLGVDCSGSMMHNCFGSDLLSCREAAAAMAMLAVRTEPNTFIHGFSTEFVDLGITKTDSLTRVMQKTRNVPFARTAVSVPMTFANSHNIEVDTFIVYTDNEVNYGPHPYQALQEYRQKTGIPAKLAVFGMENSNFTVADPNDAGMMDFCGFDEAAPNLLADFITS